MVSYAYAWRNDNARSDNDVILDEDGCEPNGKFRVGVRLLRCNLVCCVRQNCHVDAEVDVVAEFNAAVGPDDVIRSDLTTTPTSKVAGSRRRASSTTTNDRSVVDHQSLSGFESVWPKNQHVVPKAYVWKTLS